MSAVTGHHTPQGLDNDASALVMIHDLGHAPRIQRPNYTASVKVASTPPVMPTVRL